MNVRTCVVCQRRDARGRRRRLSQAIETESANRRPAKLVLNGRGFGPHAVSRFHVRLVQRCNSFLCILKSINIKISHWYYSEINNLIIRQGRCSNRAVFTLRGDDAITGQSAAFFIRELQAQRKRENSTVHRERERNVDGHASDPHSSIRVPAASLVTLQRSIRPHSASKLLL